MLYMEFIKRIIIRNSVCKLNVNWRISGFHQFQIYKQPPGSAISISSCQAWDKKNFIFLLMSANAYFIGI